MWAVLTDTVVDEVQTVDAMYYSNDVNDDISQILRKKHPQSRIYRAGSKDVWNARMNHLNALSMVETPEIFVATLEDLTTEECTRIHRDWVPLGNTEQFDEPSQSLLLRDPMGALTQALPFDLMP